MKVVITRQFHKDVKKLDNKELKGKLKTIVQNIQQANTLAEISGIKKMKDAEGNFFRIRVGDYRLGLQFLDETLYLLVLKHRKDIYKKFP